MKAQYLILSLLIYSLTAVAAPTPSSSPSPEVAPVRERPLYLPLSDIVPKEVQDKRAAKKKRRQLGEFSEQKFSRRAKVSPVEPEPTPVPSPATPPTTSPWGSDRVVDYRKFDTKIISQYRGDCSAQGLAASTENLVRRTDMTVDISQESIWSKYRKYSAWTAWGAYQKYSVKSEYGWPFGWSSWRRPEEPSRYRLAQSTDLEDNLQIAVQALDAGYPLYFARSVSRGEGGCLPVVPATGVNSQATKGGHATAIVGYRVVGGDLQFLIKQQWGAKCGDQGYQWISAATCDKPRAYCNFWRIEAVLDSMTQTTYRLPAL